MATRVETGTKGRVDWAFLLAAGGLVLIGTLGVLSAASPLPYYLSILRTHFVALTIGALLFVFGLGFNYQIFQDQAKVVWFGTVLCLVAVLVVGTVHKGHRAWIRFGVFNFQPAELARIANILVVAAFLDARARRIRDFSTVLLALGVAAPLMILIMRQPDFGTTLTFLPIMLGMLFCAGAEVGQLLALASFGAAAISMPLIYTYFQVNHPHAAANSLAGFVLKTSELGAATVGVLVVMTLLCLAAWRLSVMMRMQAKAVYFVAIPVILSAGILTGIALNKQLKGYQRNRFVAYVAPKTDLQGAAYHVRQGEIAIGSGGPWGKGLFNGTQSQLGFLPERHTDFIFSVIGEEMGFLGGISVIGLYLLLIYRLVIIGKLARDRYGFLVCSGLASMFCFELVLNVGMNLGLMPVTGVPLPLISYGGSSLVVTLWAIGIASNIYSRRYALL
jgi:rod shape determining protein RodA